MKGPPCPRNFVLALLLAVSFGTALSSIGSAASAQGLSAAQGSQSTSTVATDSGIAPSFQIANTSFTATAGGDLTIKFNVTTYQPGTLYWSVTNGSTQTAFLSLFQIESGGGILPSGVTATYPDGISSGGNRSDVAVALAFAPSTAGKTIPLQLDVWLVPESDPQHPIGTAETITVAVKPSSGPGPGSQTSPLPLQLLGTAAVVLTGTAAAGLLYARRKPPRPRPS